MRGADHREVGDAVAAPRLRGRRWWTSRPRRRPQPGNRHRESRNRTARRSLGDRPGDRVPTVMTAPSVSTRTGSIDTFARNCSTSASAIGTPAISAGPERGTWSCATPNGARVGMCSSADAGGSHNPTSASAARWSNPVHGWSGVCTCSASFVITCSKVAPITSGNWPRTCSIAWSALHHIRSSRAANRARASPTVGFAALRARRASSSGSMFGARTAHSASLPSSARRVTDESCSSLRRPSCAAAATAGSASNRRAVSKFRRAVCADSPSAPTVVSMQPRSSSTNDTSRSSRCRRRCCAINRSWCATRRSVGQLRSSSR
jgi:hypothetical protein